MHGLHPGLHQWHVCLQRLRAGHDGRSLMPNPIPPWRREQVETRQHGLCLRCGGRGSEWHHRRGRRVLDKHTHCSCNGVLLCRTCHSWVHGHPLLAMTSGWIVSRYILEPMTIPVIVDNHPWTLDCEGDANMDVTSGQ